MAKKKVQRIGIDMKRDMVDSDDDISLRKQCSLLALPWATYTYKPQERILSDEEHRLMELVYELYVEQPTRGARSIMRQLKHDKNVAVSRWQVTTCMKRLGIRAIYQKPRLSIRNREHRTYPYLLKGVTAQRSNHIWSTDITQINLPTGHAYLTAVIDWYSRYILAWQISNTMDTRFCVEVLNEALGRYGNPEIFNTDQGSQYTSEEHTSILLSRGIRISMDSVGRCLDNVFIERFWRTIKYEDIFLRGYDGMTELRNGVGNYVRYYNTKRVHQSLIDLTPEECYIQKHKELAA